ncbi:MAG: twin-arginine translocase TatA/TatE family subunit [Bacteroidaceae bacterium]|jgi:sec-independent protein translocase protein TatA|nr:twin-arginine translocase TatA/TatE family subunit [Bacteroidaceae bacterium]MBO5952383.1 twin-arginine translocase TatA/TatE family subunit [Bacteroidaceae bacterium]
MTTFLLAGLGMWEIILIVLVILLFFGAKRIPDLMKSLGKGVKSFKAGLNDLEKDINSNTETKEEKKEQ